MFYSVYDYPSRMFSYYEGGGSAPPTGWFRKPNGSKLVPERIAAKLPPDAVFVGTGDMPKGVIATLDPTIGSYQKAPSLSGVAFMPSEKSWPMWLALTGVALWVGFRWGSK